MTITLLKNFTFVLAQNQTFTTDWVSFPAEHQNATTHAHVQSMDPTSPSTGLQIKIETTFDTVESPQVGTTLTIAAVGSDDDAISSNLGPMVRAVLTNPDATTLSGTCSLWLQPKTT